MQMDTFPAGLHVLVVDDDMTWLKILEKMLRKCSYEVTTCSFARDALNMLRERKERFDIVISDVNMPDMDGFKLLEHVGLEMDLPVIMMSVDGETSRVMKGVQHGACDYLLKPIRMKELRNIWQHVFRKKKHEVKEIEGQDHESSHGIQMKNGFDKFEDELLFSSIDPNATKKRKDMGNEDHGSHEFNSNLGTVKKARVVWSVELHQKFVNAVNQIGLDKVGPKKILDLMNVPGLTRENVASHLQKYRLYLSRLQKQNEPNTSFCGVKQSDFNCKDHPGKFGHPSSTTTQQNLPNSFGYSSNKSSAQDVVPEAHDNESKSIVSFLPVTEAKNSLKGDSPVDQKLTTLPEIGEVLLFGAILQDANCTSFGSINSQQQSWSGESSGAPLMQHVKQDHESYLPLEGYPHLPLLGEQHYIQVDSLQTSASWNVRKCITDRDKVDPPVTKPVYTDYKSNHVRSVSPTASRTNSFPVQLEHDFVNQPVFGALAANSTSSSTKKHDLNQNCIGSWGSPSSLLLKNESFSASSYENLQNCALQGCGVLENVWLDDLELFDFRDSSSVTELQSYMYDGLRSSCDYQCDSPEYPVIDEGVFIA